LTVKRAGMYSNVTHRKHVYFYNLVKTVWVTNLVLQLWDWA